MPGLIGIFPANRKEDDTLLDRMVASVKHKDRYIVDRYGGAEFNGARVHLGIFNPEEQPIFNEERSLCILFDGKIYDYKPKLDELKSKGHVFRSRSDAEFCLHAYEEYGGNFVKTLNGNFVFIVYDLKNRRIIIANDRWGLRVHYYAISNGKLLFAPEAKAIMQDVDFTKELHDEAIIEFFAFAELWNGTTFFKGISALQPASILSYDGNNLKIERYWEPRYETNHEKSEEEFVDELVYAFQNAMKVRLEDSHRYGVSLSGGLDSRSVLGAIDKEKRKSVRSFGFGLPDCDEIKIARKVAAVAKTGFDVIEIPPAMIIANAEEEVMLTEGRDYMGMSYINPVHRQMSEAVDVIFDGFALDLTLGGSYLNKEKLDCTSDEAMLITLAKKRCFADRELEKLFAPYYYKKHKEYPSWLFRNEFNKIKFDISANKSDEFAIRTRVAWIPIGYSLVRASLEISHPTADNNFIDTILGIPPSWRANHRIYRKFLKRLAPDLAAIPYDLTMVRADAPLMFWSMGEKYMKGKSFLKKLAEKLSNGRIVLPRKRSYVNFGEWLRINKDWHSYIGNLLLAEDCVSSQYLDQEYVGSLLKQHIDGQSNNAFKILHLATFELFLRQFFRD